MKPIRKNFLLLAFAAGALFLIGNNVFAGEDPNESEDPDDGTIIQLYYTNALITTIIRNVEEK